MTKRWMLITGGSRGIGQALVSHLLPEWNIVFTGRNEAGIGRTLAQAKGLRTATWVKVTAAMAAMRRMSNGWRRRYLTSLAHQRPLYTTPE